MLPKTARLLIPAVLLMVALSGCDDGDNPRGIDATLAELWPNDDGRDWVYDVTVTTSEAGLALLEDPEDPLPSVSEMYLLFRDFAHEAPTTVAGDELTVMFDGEVTTMSGVTGQRLRDVWADPSRAADPVETLLWDFRPDLRDRLPEPDKLDDRSRPYGITGYCWERTESRICGYGDASTDVSWIYVDTPLEVGVPFELQLVSHLADDIWLRGMPMRQIAWTQNGHTFPRAVEVFTVIDFGVQTRMDEHGAVLGHHHPFLCYTTVFAPGVGPVYTHEWRSLADDGVLADPEPSTWEIEAVLQAPSPTD